ncbi:MAG: c-type cytochrome [Candidatus Marinimicrobia bacterium]|jgi:cytochrome c oxidase cbb3-type subunit 2|nr:c-type cytochrome [Candidatus Neomarinimicrobiota bacterium]MBT3495620.1 c-type cytochrome [Candidatus Neomarinimicrobiota bacterium]MBT3692044.1 c-type cytochrome [Candidatus Neomarinimicrobiota bacterium]MBT3731685.1 c-type cytochrome [Candidatus Neomarinimicrobiota bacterium]MBT4144288.1 c-type cytochrome [Candidatus Neomarinimicrobiota bacterium]
MDSFKRTLIVISLFAQTLIFGDSTIPDISKGERIYQSNCSGCHGMSGRGNGPASKVLNPLPRNFTDGKYLFRTTPSGSLPTDENIHKTIRNGVIRTSMPSWEGILNDSDIADVTSYIKTFAKKFTIQTPAPEVELPSTAPEKTDALVEDGKMLYRLMECFNCHGSEGRADGSSSNELENDWGEPIVPPDFAHDSFKGGNDPVDIYRTFSTGLTGTPMPAYDDDIFGFSREDIVGDYSNLEMDYTKDEIKAFDTWAKNSISGDELYNKTEDEMYAYFRMRKWALVYYVLDQREKESLIFKLFKKDYELTQ